LFYLAFFDLTTERSMGFGEGPIPWSKIEDYARIKNITGDQKSDLHQFIREMDMVYLKHRNKESKVESK
jgi:hypothetical protein